MADVDAGPADHAGGEQRLPREEQANPVPVPGGAHDATASDPCDPHICRECASDLVYPVAWVATDDERWSAKLRCPTASAWRP
jgi:hypothetical protein